MAVHVNPDSELSSRKGGAAVLVRRAGGRLADLALWVGFYLVLAVVFGSDNAEGERAYPAWFWFASALVPIGYEAWMVRYRKGQTFGKQWADVRVTPLAGETTGLPRAIVRAAVTWPFLVVATADHLGAVWQVPGIVIYVAVFAAAITNRRRRGLHDLMAGTVVEDVQ